jgi:hypothetical protein
MLDLAKLLRSHLIGRPFPHRADHEPRPERHDDDRARRKLAVGSVGVGTVDGDRHQHGDKTTH